MFLLLSFAATAAASTCFGVQNPNLGSKTFDPHYPPKLGYALVFDSEFRGRANGNFFDFDLSCEASAPSDSACTNPSGKNWYLNTWTMPNHSTSAADMHISNGLLVISQRTNHTGNWAITTRAPNGNGEIFAKGFYAEVRMASEYKNSLGQVVPPPGASAGHSSFWMYAWDHKLGAKHFSEVDFPDGIQGTADYQFNDIDWTQKVGTTLPGIGMNSFHQVDVTHYGFSRPQFVDRTSMHVYGTLWIPATSTKAGLLQSYFDGVPTGKYTWKQGALGSILDSDHMQIILGNDPPSGTDPRSTQFVEWVHIWQLSDAAVASSNNPLGIKPQANFSGGTGSCPNGP